MQKIIIGLNVDFVENRYQILAPYVDSVIAAGGFPLLVPCHPSCAVLNRFVEMVDGFVFIGGPDYPPRHYSARKSRHIRPMAERRSKADLHLARAVLRRNIPVLGICGGHQLINIAMGGKLVQHLPAAERHQKTRHRVVIKGGNILCRLFGNRKIMVNSFHHQAIAPRGVAPGLQTVARAAGNVNEAVEAAGQQFILGVQWHPERMPWRTHGAKIFSALIQEAGKRRKS